MLDHPDPFGGLPLSRYRGTATILVFLVTIFGISACSRYSDSESNEPAGNALPETVAATAKPQSPSIANEEHRVVSDLIDLVIIPHSWANDDENSVIVLKSESDPADFVLQEPGSRFLRNVPEELLNSLRQANAAGRDWTIPFEVSRTIRVSKSAFMESILHSEGWEGIQREFPRAIQVVSISRPGFSQDGQTAIIFYDFHRGPLSGGGALATMRKTPDGWAFEEEAFSFVH